MGKVTIHFEIEGLDITDVPKIRTDIRGLWNNVIKTHQGSTLARSNIDYNE